jgi:hypothetical protein
MQNLYEIILDEIDKMSAINLQSYYQQHANNKEWLRILSKFPEELQREIIDERPEGNKEDIEEIKQLKLISPQPITVNTKDVLQSTLKVDNFLNRTPQEVVDVINKNWGTQGKTEIVYDQNPQRYFQYAKMSSSTAKPSIMVNNVIEWGIGRFIATLIRGDKTINVWNMKR